MNFRLPEKGLKNMRHVLSLVMLVYLILPAMSQVEPVRVEKSVNRVMIDGKPYYIHIVRPGETLYSISRAYEVSQVEISRENPVIMMGLKADMVLKIPLIHSEPDPRQAYQDSLANFIYHRMEPGQTVYYLSREYQVTVDDIIHYNPGLSIDDIPVGQVIRIPRKTFLSPVEDFSQQLPEYIYHRVKRRETLSSLSRKYHVPVRLIRQANNGLPGGLRAGMVIRIPREEPVTGTMIGVAAVDLAAVDSVFTEPGLGSDYEELMLIRECRSLSISPGRKRVNVALFLPFYLEANDERSYIDSSEVDQRGEKIYRTIERDPNWIYPRSYNYIEFYEGALLAVNRLVEQGLSVNLYVYDTERDSATVRALLDRRDMRNMDLIIGPVFTSYPSNFQMVARFAGDHRIPVVSPLSPNNQVLQGNPYVFQVQTTLTSELDMLARYMAKFRNTNLVLVHEGDSLRMHQVEYFKRNLFNRLSFQSFAHEIPFKEVQYERRHPALDTVNTLEHALSSQLGNVVLVLSEDEPFATRVVSNLYNLSKEYDIKLVGMSAWQRFENIDLDAFFELHLRLFSSNFIDLNERDVLEFLAAFRERYHTEPPPFSFAWDGYDIMSYFLSSFLKYGEDCYYCLPSHQEDLLHTEYYFTRQDLSDGFENRKFWLLQYTPELTIRKLDWEPEDVRFILPRY